MEYKNFYENFRVMGNQQLQLPVLSGCFHIYALDYIDNSDPYALTSHAHPFFELVYCLSDEVKIVLEDSSLRLKANEILFIPMQLKHRIIPNHEHSSLIYCNFNYRIFTADEISRNSHLHPIHWCIEEELQLIQHLLRGGLRIVKDDGRCKKQLDFMVESLQRIYMGDYIILNNCFANFLICTVQAFSEIKTSDEFQSHFDGSISRLQHSAILISDYIKEYCCNDLTVENIASALNYSKRHVQRIVQNFFGISVSQMIKNCRVAKIQLLLNQDHNISIEDIAFQLGYNDIKLMQRNFKEITGQTITQYRHLLSIPVNDFDETDNFAD